VTGDNLVREAVGDLNLLLKIGHVPQTAIQYTDLIFPQELGYVDKYTVQFNNARLFDGPIDFFASVAWSKSHPNGDQVYLNDLPFHDGLNKDIDKLPEAIQETVQTVQAKTKYLYLLSSDNQDSHSGWAFYTGLCYNIESERFRNPKIGVEYFDGSQYWVGLNIAALDPYQKLNTRGSVWEIYWVQPCVENMLQFRTGYQYINRDYTESLMAGLYGNPDKTDEKDKLFYFSFEFMF
jgi:hypothetical protein